MVKVKIMGIEKYTQRYPLLYIRKLIHYKHEWNGDRIRIMTYGLDFDNNGEIKIDKSYFSMANIECNLLFNTMRKEAI